MARSGRFSPEVRERAVRMAFGHAHAHESQWAAIAVLVSILWAVAVDAAPVRVRLPEGNSRGFLVLRSLDGKDIAYGELRQKPAGGLIESQLLLNFKDGSLRDEVTAFSQRGVFRSGKTATCKASSEGKIAPRRPLLLRASSRPTPSWLRPAPGRRC